MEIADVVKVFNVNDYVSAKPFGSGNINATYLVTAKSKRYLLQKMNATALPNIAGALQNISLVTTHLSRKGVTSLELIRTINGEVAFEDSDGYVWRMYPFIENSFSYDLTNNLSAIKEIAFAFGRFDCLVRDLKVKDLVNSDPFFHNTLQKYGLLEDSIKNNRNGRVQQASEAINLCRSLITQSLSVGIDLFAVVKAKKNNEIPVRVVHNDTKLNNVLLNKTTGKHIAVVDLDTCMPGTILNDYGDGVRSNANATSENEYDLSKVKVNINKFKAFTEGFLNGFGIVNLTAKEKELLLTSVMAITFELGTRFLRDYLDGDKFFRIVSNDANFNLQRAMVQFKLLEDMINQKDKMQEIIDTNLQVCDINTN